MTSEIRVNKLTNRIGLSTVTFADSGIGVTVTGRIDPDTDSARDLGTTSVRWRNAYVDTYYGDGSNLTGITGTTINSNTNNYLITGTGTANTLQGEANLTFDGNDLTVTGIAPCINLVDTDSDDYKISNTQGVLAIRDTTAGADRFVINDNGTGYFQSNFLVGGTTTSPGATFHVKNSYASVKIDSDGANNDVNLYFKIGANKKNIINFGDNDDTDIGQIFYDHNGDYMSFKTNTTEKLRITSSGRVNIGDRTTSPDELVHIHTASGDARVHIEGADDAELILRSHSGDSTIIFSDASASNVGNINYDHGTDSLSFRTNSAEHVRINQHGFVKMKGDMSSHMSADGNNYHEMQADNPHIQILNMKHGSSNGYGIMMQFNHGKSTHWAFRVYNYASGSTNAFIRTDGDLENINNSYGGTSDVKLKENIVDASSQWDDIKALRVRNFNYKSDESKTKMLGLVAQEAEQVCPSLVKDQPDLGEENEDLGTTTKFMKYSIVYMKAIKALQEAQERIEKLEQENIALRVRVTNLEDN